MAPQLKSIAPEGCPSCWPAVFPSAVLRCCGPRSMPKCQRFRMDNSLLVICRSMDSWNMILHFLPQLVCMSVSSFSFTAAVIYSIKVGSPCLLPSPQVATTSAASASQASGGASASRCWQQPTWPTTQAPPSHMDSDIMMLAESSSKASCGDRRLPVSSSSSSSSIAMPRPKLFKLNPSSSAV